MLFFSLPFLRSALRLPLSLAAEWKTLFFLFQFSGCDIQFIYGMFSRASMVCKDESAVWKREKARANRMNFQFASILRALAYARMEFRKGWRGTASMTSRGEELESWHTGRGKITSQKRSWKCCFYAECWSEPCTKDNFMNILVSLSIAIKFQSINFLNPCSLKVSGSSTNRKGNPWMTVSAVFGVHSSITSQQLFD